MAKFHGTIEECGPDIRGSIGHVKHQSLEGQRNPEDTIGLRSSRVSLETLRAPSESLDGSPNRSTRETFWGGTDGVDGDKE